MKNTIPFDLFGTPEELCFKIEDMQPLERALGRSVQQIFSTAYFGYDFVFCALPFCLRKVNPHIYREKVREYLTGGPNREIDDIAVPLMHAIAISGALGKEKMEYSLSQYYPELCKEPQEEPEKNAKRTAK
jgi:hypothetical protein